MRSAFVSVALVAAAFACTPDLPDRDSLVTSARVVAIKVEPAESAQGGAMTLTALVAAPIGASENGEIAWAFCEAPRPVGENGVVASACQRGESLEAIGASTSAIAASMPGDACALFGPTPPPGGYRPADPDVTGGYYQPVLAQIDAPWAFGLARVTCDLANAPADLASAFRKRYVKNKNPTIRNVTVPDAAAPGARVPLAIAWSSDDAESYVAFDAASQTIVDRREEMRVSWYATAGALELDRTGRDEDDPATDSANTWTAPNDASAVRFFIVLRDSRGGVDFATKDIAVRAP